MDEREERIEKLNKEIDILSKEQDRLIFMINMLVEKLELNTIILDHRTEELKSVF